MNNLCIGDLVRFIPLGCPTSFGLVVGIISECLVEVMWAGTEYTYMESVSNLEVVNGNRRFSDNPYKE